MSRVLVLACGALAREIRAVIAANNLDHLDLQCLPAQLHNTPAHIPAAVKAAIDAARETHDQIFVAYADCGTGGALQRLCDDEGVTMIPGPHCYAFFDGITVFENRGESTAFYLTDFLARQFDAFVWKPLGLDAHPELLPMYFGNYETLVYLAQTDDAELTLAAQSAAARLGLRFVKRQTGYGDLTEQLSAL